mgnify:CR=1 FL=1
MIRILFFYLPRNLICKEKVTLIARQAHGELNALPRH